MEDILASIRRILNEDESAAGTVPPPGAPPASAEPEPLALTEEMMVAPPASAGGPDAGEPGRPAAAAAEDAAAAPSPVTEGKPMPHAPEEAPRPTPAASAELLAPAAAAAAAASVGSLLRAVAAERHAAVSRGGPTIEDLVRDELRPLLKDWLDHHLPPLVERLVRAEIERVVGRALS